MDSLHIDVKRQCRQKRRRKSTTISGEPCSMRRWVCFVAAMAALTSLPGASSSSSSTASPTSSGTTTPMSSDDIERLGMQGVEPDKFVLASPLIVAAVCSDGVALIASHTVSVKEQLLRRVDVVDEIKDSTTTIAKEEEEEEEEDKTELTTISKKWRDLPADHGGPYRIHRIDRLGTHLMCAGWRADCEMLTEKCRAISRQEIGKFGAPQWGLPYGRFLAMEASYWMAQRAVSEQVRALSCVGLLSACADDNHRRSSSQDNPASLWLIEATGAYRVRALAIGGGMVEGGPPEEKRMVADIVNQYLQQVDFSTMTAKEGALCILQILNGDRKSSLAASSNEQGDEPKGEEGLLYPLVPADSELEIAITNSERRQTRRLSLSSLLALEDQRQKS